MPLNTETASQKNKRIAKNTLILYLRMILLMAVSLYTSRVTLDVLGIRNYGIYTVVGGVVSMFSIISGSLTASIQRFLTFELGTGNIARLKRIFSSAVNIQIILAVIVMIVAEIVGTWFLNHKMNIEPSRLYAANWVLQCSIVTFMINLVSVPYNAAIIAHEKMSAFAYISILEAALKLTIVYLLFITTHDRLIFYAVALAGVAILLRIIYGIYCKRNFEECVYHFSIDRSLIKELFGFAGWNFIGASSAIMRDQGGNIIINLFYGTLVNAATGVATQINTAVTGFVTNFMTALNPQITKSYASGDRDYMMSLIYKGAKFSFFMLLMISLPIMIKADYLLSVWLVKVPEYAPLFARLILLFALCESYSNPLVTAMLATGRIRNYQIVVGGLQMLNLPIAYVLLRNGFAPQWVYIVAIIISQCCFAARMLFLRGMIGLRVRQFILRVYCVLWTVAIVSAIVPLWMSYMLPDNFVSFVGVCITSVVWCAIIIYSIGLTTNDRQFIRARLHPLLKKLHPHHD